MGVKIGGHVEKLNAKELTYGEFVKTYVQKNQPVVLSGLMGDWKACTDWVFPDGIPNLRFFSSHFGKSTVQVADCATREFSDQKRIEMSVSEFINHCLEGSSEEPTNGSKFPLYLKDWHFTKEYPKYAAYETPLFFSDDWLNFYLDNYCMHMDPSTYQEKNVISCSDYRFVYMGAKGTWTPLHADVFKSYSWSANVCGRKQWHFLSPSQHHLVFDRHLKNTVYDIFEDISETKFPGFSKAIWLECTQERNEIIFVPSGWYHQVHNLEDTISINHNWFNAHNLSWVWDVLVHDYGEAKEYIEDIKDICDDFEGLCQRNLAANTGMNFNDFFVFIAHMCFANLVQLCYTLRDHRNHNGSLSPVAQHLALNIVYIRQIILKMKSIKGSSGGRGVLLDLEEILDSPKFLELCDGLGKSYRMIHGELKPLSDTKEALLGCIKGLNWTRSYNSSLVQSTQDVINIMDSALSELRGTSGGECISHCLDELLKLEEVRAVS